MKYVDYERPTNLKAALEILQNNGETTKILAGGTDILTKLRIRREQPDLLLDSKEIPELNELSYNADSGLTIGGAVPLYKLYAHADVMKYYQSIRLLYDENPIVLYLENLQRYQIFQFQLHQDSIAQGDRNPSLHRIGLHLRDVCQLSIQYPML